MEGVDGGGVEWSRGWGGGGGGMGRVEALTLSAGPYIVNSLAMGKHLVS